MSDTKPTIDGEEVARVAAECAVAAGEKNGMTQDELLADPVIMGMLQAFARYWMARGMEEAAKVCDEKTRGWNPGCSHWICVEGCARGIREAAKQLEVANG